MSDSATLAQQIYDAVEKAVLAPSSHNTQPWLFRILPDGVELRVDRRRTCPVVDPEDRELLISCGAALYHLRLALNHEGFATLVRVLPRSSDRDLVARVLIAGAHVVTDDDRLLYEAISKRRTNRFPFEDRGVDCDLQAEWINDVKSERAWMRLFHSLSDRNAIAELVCQGDRVQASDKAFRAELAGWVHSNHSNRRDGLPGYTHGTGDFASNFESFAIRSFDWGDGQAARDQKLVEASPVIAVLGTKTDTPTDWVACGQALEKMLLRAAAWSIDASFMNQPIEVPDLRNKLAMQVEAEGFPQILLRLGFGREVRPAPRRPTSEMIVNDEIFIEGSDVQ